MKFTRITALLGLAQLTFHAGVFGTQKPFAKLSEEDLEKIENALAGLESEGLAEELESTKQSLSDAVTNLEVVKKNSEETAQAVEAALETAGLKEEAKESVVENIALLGEKCKEFGGSKNRHSLVENDGKENSENGLIGGFMNPEDEHNKLLQRVKK